MSIHPIAEQLRDTFSEGAVEASSIAVNAFRNTIDIIASDAATGTTLVYGRRGKIVGAFEQLNPEARAEITNSLQSVLGKVAATAYTTGYAAALRDHGLDPTT